MPAWKFEFASVQLRLLNSFLVRHAGCALGLDYKRIPHACFRFELPVPVIVRDEIAGILERGLRGRFDSVDVWKIWFIAQWFAVVRLGQKSFTVLFRKSRYKDDEWVLLVGPLDVPGIMDRLRGRPPGDAAPELIRICRETHNALATANGVSAIRWYFEGFGSQSVAVATPDDLPWTGA